MLTKKDKLYLDLAKRYAQESTCLRHHVGAVITINNRIICAGYNGAPTGLKDCVSKGVCMRKDAPSGSSLQNCLATHAEMNAICQAAKLGISIEGGTLYCTTKPCSLCTKIIINAGIKKIIYEEDYPDKFADKLLKESKIEVIQAK